MEEIVWGNVIWYGIGDWESRGTGGRGINADFFMYTLLYSVRTAERRLALALPTQRAPRHLSALPTQARPQGRIVVFCFCFAVRIQHARPLVRQSLLQTYLAVSTAWYIMRGGHHALLIADFYMATDMQLTAPTRAGAAASWTPAPRSAWPRVTQSAVRFPDEHMPKIARALAEFAARWGTRAPGRFSPCAATGEEMMRTGAAPAPALEGIERLDGTLFVHVAGLAFDRLRWVDEDEKAVLWDRDDFPMSDAYGASKDGSLITGKFGVVCKYIVITSHSSTR